MHGVQPTYLLLATAGEKKVAAISYAGENDNNIIYRPHDRFIHDYGKCLGLHANLQWTSEAALAIWLSAVVYNSFVYCSTLDDLCTACFPSVFNGQSTLMTFGYTCGTTMFNGEEVVQRLYPMVKKLNLDEVTIKMGNRAWTIPPNNMSISYPIFREFIEELATPKVDGFHPCYSVGEL